MIKSEKVKVTCIHCGKSFPSSIFPVLDVEQDPRLYRKALDTTVFIKVCPYCQKDTVFPYACIYLDKQRKLIIGAGMDEKMFMENVLHLVEDIQQYTLRIVDQPVELSEKLELYHARMKDTLIECMKYHLMETMHDQGIDAVHLIYHQNKMIVIDSQGNAGTVNFEQSWYQEAVRVYKDLAETKSKGVLKIDDAWAKSVLHPLKLEETDEAVSIN